jgi:hypothetical protein
MSKRTSCRLLTLVVLLLLHPPALSSGQTPPSPAGSDSLQRARAAQELEGVLAESDSLEDRRASVVLRVRAACLLWPRERERARRLFGEVWDWIGAQGAEGFNRDEAYDEVLRNLFPRDKDFAAGLLKRLSAERKSDDAPAGGVSPDVLRLNRLASGLMDSNPEAAANLLEQSLSRDLLPTTLSMLLQLRKSDRARADAIVGRILRDLASRPTSQSLPTAYTLIDYFFPAPPARVAAADDALRRQFYFTAREVLIRAAREFEQRLGEQAAGGERANEYRAFFLSQLARAAVSLAARYEPEGVPEIGGLLARLSALVPARLNELAQYNGNRFAGGPPRPKEDAPAAGVALALKGNDFAEARRLLDGVEGEVAKKFLGYEIDVAEFGYDLGKPDLEGALALARVPRDAPTAARMFSQLAAAAHKKGDAVLARQVLAEARLAFTRSACGEDQAQALLSLAAAAAPISADISVELLSVGVTCVNELTGPPADGEKKATPGHMFYESPALHQAFASAGKVALDGALAVAGRFDEKAIRLSARLSACAPWLEKGGEKNPPASVRAAAAPAKR